jgi:hypothetical protein
MRKRLCGCCGKKVIFPNKKALEDYIEYLRSNVCNCEQPDLRQYLADYDRNTKVIAEQLKRVIVEQLK